MNKTFEKELPEGYEEIFTVDATDKKLGIILNVAAIVIMLVLGAAGYFIIRPQNWFDNYSLLRDIAAVLCMFAYIVLHELTHGAAYKLLTGEKLSYGFTATVAYCGVPDIYVYRKTALIALLAPFTVFSIVFFTAALLIPGEWNKLYALILFAIHFGGCAGDLYDTYLFLFKFKDPATLMRDTGPKQSIYLNKQSE